MASDVLEVWLVRDGHTYIVRTTRANIIRAVVWIGHWVFDPRLNFEIHDAAAIATELKERI